MRSLQLAALAVAAAACLGPKPVVEEVSASEVRDQVTVVSVTVRNTGSGDGPASLAVTVRDTASGEVVGREERAIQLGPRERLTVGIEVHVRPGIQSVTAEAEIRYPPE